MRPQDAGVVLGTPQQHLRVLCAAIDQTCVVPESDCVPIAAVAPDLDAGVKTRWPGAEQAVHRVVRDPIVDRMTALRAMAEVVGHLADRLGRVVSGGHATPPCGSTVHRSTSFEQPLGAELDGTFGPFAELVRHARNGLAPRVHAGVDVEVHL